MKTRKWIVLVTKDRHLEVPYIVTEDECGSPRLFDSERDALCFLSDSVGYENGQIVCFEVEE